LRANTFALGALAGAFKAATLAQLIGASPWTVVLLASLTGAAVGAAALRIEAVARTKTVVALAVTAYFAAVDCGLVAALGSRIASWALFAVLLVTAALLVLPLKAQLPAFVAATAAAGGCVFKLSVSTT
jgi:hypothetical protein